MQVLGEGDRDPAGGVGSPNRVARRDDSADSPAGRAVRRSTLSQRHAADTAGALSRAFAGIRAAPADTGEHEPPNTTSRTANRRWGQRPAGRIRVHAQRTPRTRRRRQTARRRP